MHMFCRCTCQFLLVLMFLVYSLKTLTMRCLHHCYLPFFLSTCTRQQNCEHLQTPSYISGQCIGSILKLDPWKWNQYIAPKHQQPTTNLWWATSQRSGWTTPQCKPETLHLNTHFCVWDLILKASQLLLRHIQTLSRLLGVQPFGLLSLLFLLSDLNFCPVWPPAPSNPYWSTPGCGITASPRNLSPPVPSTVLCPYSLGCWSLNLQSPQKSWTNWQLSCIYTHDSYWKLWSKARKHQCS